MRESVALGSAKTAVYKGLKVDVFTIDKSEVSLSRQDLVELINVRILFYLFIFLLPGLPVSVSNYSKNVEIFID